MKLSDINRQQFRIPGVEGIWWNGGPVMTEEEHPQAGYVVISLSGKDNHWYPNDTEVEPVEELNKPLSAKVTVSKEVQNYINANKHLWSSAPGMSVSDLKVLQTGSVEEIRQWLKEKQAEKDQQGVPNAVTGVEYDKEAVQKEHDRIVGKEDVEFPRGSEEDYVKWAEEELAKVKMSPEDEQKAFSDTLMHDRQLYHIGDDGIRVIQPYSQEYWEALEKSKGKSMTISSEMSIEEITEKFELSIEEVERIKKAVARGKGINEYQAGIDPIHREEGKPAEVYVFRNPPEPGQEYTIDQLNDKNTGEWRSVNENKYKELEAKILQIAKWLKMLDKNLDMEISSNVKMCKDITGADYIPIMHGTKLMIQDMYNKLDITTKIQGEI